ncbi:MAG: acetylxylan esterase [Acidobacteria bacterium]|nr:acetylxylan esterase [Acidobacteriota bacterium]
MKKTSAGQGQAEFNYDESRVRTYTLPDPLNLDGVAVRTREQWPARRTGILELFRRHVYGRRPGKPAQLRFEVVEHQPKAMNGAATLRRVAVVSEHQGRQHRFEVILFLPNARLGAVPTFLLLNNRPISNTDATRAERSPFWPAEEMVARGYGIAALQVGDLAPDNAKQFTEGVIRLFEGDAARSRPADAWAALAAWGWGASRALDYFETEPRIDARRVAVVGHSRGGKAALWAGAEDERFALVVSNDSGEGGAALARRNFGETTARLNTSFPFWFNTNFKQFNGRETEMPVDQHMLLALIAPRALYVASADQDLWADPRGEFLALAHSSPVYALYGEPVIATDAMPPIDTPLIVGRRGYHVRTGGHNLTTYDWAQFATLADGLGWKAN